MSKLRRCAIVLAVLLVATPLLGGVSLAQDNYTLQYITSYAGNPNYLEFQQGISGFSLSNFSQTGTANVNFTNTSVSGVYNKNFGIGSFSNQGSVAFLNLQPNLEVTPMTLSGEMFSQGNQVSGGNYNYGVNLTFNGFQGTGLVALNVMAGSFCNQFTSLTFNMGKNAISQTPSTPDMRVMQGNSSLVSLTNQQLQVVAGTANNDIQMQGTTTPVKDMINGTPNIQGVSAITVSAGVNNQISNNVSVTFNTTGK
jgi:hypothetical protein